ncbi:MAG: prolipoprotein diacylglyceryl transferase [Candidatus Gracilibacteria bacterium]|jgi:prolipoprotein diacylglyceryl transferase
MIFVNNLDPILFDFGFAEVRWYGLFFAVGLVLNYLILSKIFRREKLPAAHLESLALYLFLGLVIGARIGHVVFYNFAYFAAHPTEVFAIWNGGLSSHGATIGLLLAYTIWILVHKVKFAKYADLIAIPMPLTAAFVRFGNFFNSEIVGNPTGSYGIVFKRLGEDFPRHPSQLYEAFALLLIFAVLMWMYFGRKKKEDRALATARAYPPLFFMFTFILFYFVARFFIEYTKDLHVFQESFPLSMGQVLSILPILAALVYFIWIIFRPVERA